MLSAEAVGSWQFREPELAGFDHALAIIRDEQARSDLCLVAIDQPTIVPNASGSRPVDKIAASLVSWLGGGVQPANRSKLGMFDDAAPIWHFKRRLGAVEDPETARTAAEGLFIAEVFPALALPSWDHQFFGRLKGPRYNPARRKTFKLESWRAVVACVSRAGRTLGVEGHEDLCTHLCQLVKPRKADQDRLDAVICALVGLHWLTSDRRKSVMIGDLESGYMIAPASPQVRDRLSAAAEVRGVPIDLAVRVQL